MLTGTLNTFEKTKFVSKHETRITKLEEAKESMSKENTPKKLKIAAATHKPKR